MRVVRGQKMERRRSLFGLCTSLTLMVVTPVVLPSLASAETQLQAVHVTTDHATKPNNSTNRAAAKPPARAQQAPLANKVVTPPAPLAVIQPRDVLCVAGCPGGATPPQLVHSGNKPLAVPMQVPKTSPNQLEQHTTAIYCYNGGGCRSHGFYRPKLGHGYYDAVPQEHSGYPSRNSVYVIDR
jgi:hypothetical protein